MQQLRYEKGITHKYGHHINVNEVYDCFDNAVAGQCLGSKANDPRDCINRTTGSIAKKNCTIKTSFKQSEVFVKLICDVPIIFEHEELLVGYGQRLF